MRRRLVTCIALASVVAGGCANSEDSPSEQSATSSTTTSMAAPPESTQNPVVLPTFAHDGVTARVDFVGALAAEADDGGTTNRATRVAYALTTSEGGTLHFSVGRDQDQREFELVVTPEMLGLP